MRAPIGKALTRRLIDSPVFVIGANRSGTSVLLRALSAHPLIRGATGEAPLITAFASVPDSLEYSEFREYYTDNLRTTKEYLYSGLRRLSFEYVVGPNYGLDGITRELRAGDFSIRKQRHWCAKIAAEEGHCRGLRKLFPGSRFVYIVRNGIEVVHSRTKFVGFRSLGFEAQCRAWASSFGHFDHLARAQDALQVRHENLVSDPSGFLRRVFLFLGLEPCAEAEELVKSTLVIPLDQPDATGVDVRQVLASRRPPYERWSSEQRSAFRAIAGDAMIRAGYEIPF